MDFWTIADDRSGSGSVKGQCRLHGGSEANNSKTNGLDRMDTEVILKY
jgi:hypothetical protein